MSNIESDPRYSLKSQKTLANQPVNFSLYHCDTLEGFAAPAPQGANNDLDGTLADFEAFAIGAPKGRHGGFQSQNQLDRYKQQQHNRPYNLRQETKKVHDHLPNYRDGARSKYGASYQGGQGSHRPC